MRASTLSHYISMTGSEEVYVFKLREEIVDFYAIQKNTKGRAATLADVYQFDAVRC
ncbi:hypothetical protein Brsp01_06740 [Brucella sp. NBRC 12950]|jgi:hypothetical protein|nr:hypothetical protein Brsp01_06740 [Brucella sp. NBRC 12950]